MNFFFFFEHSEFLCFTLLSNFVKKILCQMLRRRANLETIDLIHQTTYWFCIFDSLDTFFGVVTASIRRATVIVISSSLPDWHDFFLITPRNSTLFSINTWKFHLLFLQYPWKFHILNPRLIFFWNSPLTWWWRSFEEVPLVKVKS